MNDSSDDPVLLCQDCYSLLTVPGTSSYADCWPSFVWNLFMDRDILDVYGENIWRMIPGKWRYWWIDKVKEISVLNGVTINTPPSIFIDITSNIYEMKSGIESNTLANLKKCCNKHLMPSILCPWGESEYIHQCGKFPFDAFLQRFLPKCYIDKISNDKICENIYSSREDYVRGSIEDYDCILLNPEWKVLPSVAFIDDKGPYILTCRHHDGGTNKAYIHTPRQPYHVIPSEHGDQLSHAVIKTRFIKPMKAKKFSNTYQMHEQRGSFQGIDTCDVTDYGNFGICSVLLEESESRSIMHRPDINSLLDRLGNDMSLSQVTINGFRKRAKEVCPPDDVIAKCLVGATYVSLEDAMELQVEIGTDQGIRVKLLENDQGIQNVVDTRHNWIQSIIHCQRNDKEGYGAIFPVVPQFRYNDTDTRQLWIVSGMLLCVKELWYLTDKYEMDVSNWHGWVLSYLTRKCFPGITIKSHNMNPIRSTYVTTIPKLIEKWE